MRHQPSTPFCLILIAVSCWAALPSLAGAQQGGALDGFFERKPDVVLNQVEPVVAPAPQAAQSAATRAWTVMLYIGAENNLEQASLLDIEELERLPASDEVAFVFLLDKARAPGSPASDSFEGTFRGRIVADAAEGCASLQTGKAEGLGNLRTSDPAVLRDFVAWGASNYPARRYALVLWSHGSGWRSSGTRAIIEESEWDAQSGRFVHKGMMQNRQVREAIGGGGVRLDLLAMDACLMGMAEVVWEFRELAPVIVASQESIPSYGYNYRYAFEGLVANPNLDAEGLSRHLVAAYEREYVIDPNEKRPVTLTAYRSADFAPGSELAAAVDGFVDACGRSQGAVSSVAQVAEARRRDAASDTQECGFVDLMALTDDLAAQSTASPALREAARRLGRAAQNSVLAHTTNRPGRLRGMNIFLPPSPQAPNYANYTPENARFAGETRWGGLVKAVAEGNRSALAVPANAEAPGELPPSTTSELDRYFAQ